MEQQQTETPNKSQPLSPVFFGFTVLFAGLIDWLFMFKQIGISLFIFTLILIIFYEIAKYIQNKKFSINRYHALIIPLLYFSAIFALRTNYTTIILASLAYIVLMPFYLILTSNPGYFIRFSGFELSWMYIEGSISLRNIFWSFITFAFRFVKNTKSKKEKGRIALHTIVGILITIPLFLFVLLLLRSADQVFTQNINQIFSVLPSNIFVEFFKLGFALVLSYFLWSYIAGFINSTRLKKTILENSILDYVSPEIIIPAILTIALNLLYVLFVFVQFEYLIGGEEFIRKNNLILSEYAIHGFWEMIVVSLLNFAILYFAQTRFDLKGKISKILMNANYVFMIFASLVMVYSSHVRLWSYEGKFGYGFTEERLIPHLFLIFITALMLLAFANLFIKQNQKRAVLNIGVFIITNIYVMGFAAFPMESFIVSANMQKFYENKDRPTAAVLDLDYLMNDLGLEGHVELLKYRNSAELQSYFEHQEKDKYQKTDKQAAIFEKNIKTMIFKDLNSIDRSNLQSWNLQHELISNEYSKQFGTSLWDDNQIYKEQISKQYKKKYYND